MFCDGLQEDFVSPLSQDPVLLTSLSPGKGGWFTISPLLREEEVNCHVLLTNDAAEAVMRDLVERNAFRTLPLTRIAWYDKAEVQIILNVCNELRRKVDH
jgi:hypothetical protein